MLTWHGSFFKESVAPIALDTLIDLICCNTEQEQENGIV